MTRTPVSTDPLYLSVTRLRQIMAHGRSQYIDDPIAWVDRPHYQLPPQFRHSTREAMYGRFDTILEETPRPDDRACIRGGIDFSAPPANYPRGTQRSARVSCSMWLHYLDLGQAYIHPAFGLSTQFTVLYDLIHRIPARLMLDSHIMLFDDVPDDEFSAAFCDFCYEPLSDYLGVATGKTVGLMAELGRTALMHMLRDDAHMSAQIVTVLRHLIECGYCHFSGGLHWDEALHPLETIRLGPSSRWGTLPDDIVPPARIAPWRMFSGLPNTRRSMDVLSRRAHLTLPDAQPSASTSSTYSVLLSSGGTSDDPYGPVDESPSAVIIQRMYWGFHARSGRVAFEIIELAGVVRNGHARRNCHAGYLRRVEFTDRSAALFSMLVMADHAVRDARSRRCSGRQLHLAGFVRLHLFRFYPQYEIHRSLIRRRLYYALLLYSSLVLCLRRARHRVSCLHYLQRAYRDYYYSPGKLGARGAQAEYDRVAHTAFPEYLPRFPSPLYDHPVSLIQCTYRAFLHRRRARFACYHFRYFCRRFLRRLHARASSIQRYYREHRHLRRHACASVIQRCQRWHVFADSVTHLRVLRAAAAHRRSRTGFFQHVDKFDAELTRQLRGRPRSTLDALTIAVSSLQRRLIALHVGYLTSTMSVTIFNASVHVDAFDAALDRHLRGGPESTLTAFTIVVSAFHRRSLYHWLLLYWALILYARRTRLRAACVRIQRAYLDYSYSPGNFGYHGARGDWTSRGLALQSRPSGSAALALGAGPHGPLRLLVRPSRQGASLCVQIQIELLSSIIVSGSLYSSRPGTPVFDVAATADPIPILRLTEAGTLAASQYFYLSPPFFVAQHPEPLAICFRSVAGRHQIFVVSSRSLRAFRLLAYFYRSRRRSVPFVHHRLLLSPFRGHNAQSYHCLRRLLSVHSLASRRPFPPGGFYRPVPHKICGYGSSPLVIPSTFTGHREFAFRTVIGWYNAAGPHLLATAISSDHLVAAFGFSDCNGFGSELPRCPVVPVQTHLIDRFVHPSARAFFGDQLCHDGDALDIDLRSSLCRLPAFVGNHDSPECDAYSVAGELTRKRVRSPQQIGACRAVLSCLFKQYGVPYTIEMVRTSKDILPDRACRLRGIDFGLRTADSHWIETPPGFRLFCDEALVSVGSRLLVRSCTGAQNSLPGLDCFGGPFPTPCCDGNITSFHGTTSVCSVGVGSGRLGIDPQLVPTWGHLVNCTPPAFGLFSHAQLCCLLLDHRCHVPFVSYDSLVVCPSLRCFSITARVHLSWIPTRPTPITLPLLRPLWPRFEAASLSIFPAGLDPGSPRCVIVCGDLSRPVLHGTRHSLDSSRCVPYRLPYVRLTPGEPLLESCCGHFLRSYGIEASAFRPFLALVTSSALHFCITLPLSDDIMTYLRSRGADGAAVTSSSRLHSLPQSLLRARSLRLVPFTLSRQTPALFSAEDFTILSAVCDRSSSSPASPVPASTLVDDILGIPLPSSHAYSSHDASVVRAALYRHLLRRRSIRSASFICFAWRRYMRRRLRLSSSGYSAVSTAMPSSGSARSLHGLTDLSLDPSYGPGFYRSPYGLVLHLDEDSVFRPVDEFSFDDRPNSLDSMVSRGGDGSLSLQERSSACSAASARCAQEGSAFAFTAKNVYWHDAVARQLLASDTPPPPPSAHSFSADASPQLADAGGDLSSIDCQSSEFIRAYRLP